MGQVQYLSALFKTSKFKSLLKLGLLLFFLSACGIPESDNGEDPIVRYSEVEGESDPWTDSSDDSAGFGGGTHSGTKYLTDKVRLANNGGCDSTTINCTELDSTWTPQWSSLVAYWKMNESSWNGTLNEVVDSSGNAKHGTRTGNATTSTTRKFGAYAGTFDGNGDYIIVDNAVLPMGQRYWSVCTWFKVVYDGLNRRSIFETNPTYSMSTEIQGSGIYAGWTVRTDGSAYNCTSSGNRYDDNQWHHGCTVYNDGVLNCYVDGALRGTSGSTDGIGIASITKFLIGTYRSGDGRWFNGQLDEMAMWSAALTSNDVQTIWARQSAKYAGRFTSRIFDAAASNSWDGFKFKTTLPFGKELTGDSDNSGSNNSSDNESSSDYSSLVGSDGSTSDDDFMSGLRGLWHMNGTEGTIADAASVTDSSGYTHTGSANDDSVTNNIRYTNGKFLQSIQFDGANDSVVVSDPASGNLDFGTGSFTISAWFYPHSVSSGRILAKGYTAYSNGYSLSLSLNYLWCGLGGSGVAANSVFMYNASDLSTGRWYHVACVYNASTHRMYLYINGVAKALTAFGGTCGTVTGSTALDTTACTSLNASNANPLKFGMNSTASSEYYNGRLDEVAIWGRALHASEVLQLYRRGANRVSFQVRACTMAACADAPRWLGPAGDPGATNNDVSFFSELQNNSSLDAAGLPTGRVLTDFAQFLFSSFSDLTVPTERYFQYRFFLESDDDGTGCDYGSGAIWCSPELESVTVSP